MGQSGVSRSWSVGSKRPRATTRWAKRHSPSYRRKAQSKRFDFFVPAKAGTHASQPYRAWIPAFTQ